MPVYGSTKTYIGVKNHNNFYNQQGIHVDITESDGMTISETHSNYTGYGVSCNGEQDGSIDVTVTGGTGVYTYAWSNGASSEDISDLGAGTYSVTATDENGCSVSIEVEITETEEMSFTLDNLSEGPHILGAISAGLGDVSISIAGGTGVYEYAWSSVLADGSIYDANSQDISDIFAGTYAVTITDENGCSTSAKDTINDDNKLSAEVDLLLTNDVTCYDYCDLLQSHLN